MLNAVIEPSMFGSPAPWRYCRREAEEEIGRRVAGVLAVEREVPVRTVDVGEDDAVVAQLAAELQVVLARSPS